jgi:acetyl esterase
VQWTRAEGMVHGFARMLVASPAARQAVEAACQMLEQVRRQAR